MLLAPTAYAVEASHRLVLFPASLGFPPLLDDLRSPMPEAFCDDLPPWLSMPPPFGRTSVLPACRAQADVAVPLRGLDRQECYLLGPRISPESGDRRNHMLLRAPVCRAHSNTQAKTRPPARAPPPTHHARRPGNAHMRARARPPHPKAHNLHRARGAYLLHVSHRRRPASKKIARVSPGCLALAGRLPLERTRPWRASRLPSPPPSILGARGASGSWLPPVRRSAVRLHSRRPPSSCADFQEMSGPSQTQRR